MPVPVETLTRAMDRVMLATVDTSMFSLVEGVEGWVYEACFFKTGREEEEDVLVLLLLLLLLTREVGILVFSFLI